MSKSKKPLFSKIEIDEKTAEPKIVIATEKDIAADFAREELHTDAECARPVAPDKARGEQLIMSKVLGINKDSSVSQRQKVFKHISTAVFIVLVAIVLFYTAYNDFFTKKELPSLEYLSGVFSQNWFYILLALLSLLLCFFFKGLKLSIMCRSLTGKWKFKTCVETGIIGHYYNNVTPLAVGGQPFEIYHLSKNGIHGGTASSLPISAYFLHQFSFVLLGIVSLVLFKVNFLDVPKEIIGVMPSIVSIVAIVGLVFAMLMPTIVIIFSILPKFASIIVTFVMNLGNKLKLVKDPVNTTSKTLKNVEYNADCIRKLARRPFVFTSSFILSIGEHLALCSIAYFTLRFFGFDWPAKNIVEWSQVIQLCLILYAAISFIPTPGNSGAADLSFYLLFDTGLMIGANKLGGLAFPAMIVWRLLSFYSFIIVGFIFTTLNRKKHARLAAAETASTASETSSTDSASSTASSTTSTVAPTETAEQSDSFDCAQIEISDSALNEDDNKN